MKSRVKELISRAFRERGSMFTSDIEALSLDERYFATPSTISRTFRRMRKNGEIVVTKQKVENRDQCKWSLVETQRG